ncbi:MopE-related protein [Flavobacterium sp.]|uniref:MopE-related protein n=1 Tax=Flavobacterium sp. TaxID=239 RepID=UPI0039E3732B
MQNKLTTRAMRNLARYATILLFLCSLKGFSQTYYPIASNNWGAGASWSTASCAGSSALSIPSTTGHTVSMSCSGRTITVASNANAGALNISAGTLIINSGSTLTVTSLNMTAGTLTVNGTLNITSGGTGVVSITGGTVNGTGTVGLTGGAQNLSSSQPFYNLNIAGSGNKTMLTNITVNNQLTLTANNLVVGNFLLTVGSSSAGNGITRNSGKMTLSSGSSLSLGGSWTNTDLSPFISNTWPLTINNFTMTRNLCSVGLGTGHNLTVAGAFTLTAGEFSIGNSTLTLNGAVSGNINGSITGGSTSDLTIGGSGAASMYFDLGNTNAGGSNTIRNFTNNRTSNAFTMLSSLRIGGTLSQASTASLQITTGSVQTLTIDGAVAAGNSRLVGNSGAILQINGSGDLGGTLVFSSTPVLASLTMNRLNGTATIGTGISTGGIAFRKGKLFNPGAPIRVTGGAASNTLQELSSSYCTGIFEQTIPANTSAGDYLWPIGGSVSRALSFNGVTTGSSGSVVLRAVVVETNANSTGDGTISDIRTSHYWETSVTSNAANLLSVGTVSLSDSNLSATDVIGYAPALLSTATSLGGTIASGAITSTADVPVALGILTLGTGQSVCTDPTVATINASSTTNCGTQATTLSIASGSLNSAENWQWYSGSCGGTSVGSGTSINVSPTATTTYFVRGEGGCITPGACASVTITVNTPQLWYADADGDGHGNPNSTSNACTQPTGYVLTSDDCDDTNGLIYRTGIFYIDADGDGYTNGQATVCYGLNTPLGYSTTTNGEDCNDNNAAVWRTGTFYTDADSDGYTSGVTAEVCYGLTMPVGYVTGLTAIDCNDSIAAINPSRTEILYNGVDDNCDGFMDEQSPLTTSLLSNVCNTTLTAIGSLVGIQTVGGHNITGYRIRITNGAQVQTIDKIVPHFTITQFPNYAYATTYDVDIQLQRNGIWLGYYGPVCQISTPAILQEGGAASISPSQCGITLPSISTLIATSSIAGVTGYRFRVTNLTNPQDPDVVQTLDRAQNWFRLQMLAHYNYGTTYRIEVAVKTTGNYGGYGSPCEITSPPPPSLLSCGATIASGTTAVAATSVSGASQYRFQISRQSDNATTTMDRNTNYFIFNSIPPAAFSPGVLYNVRVAVMTNGSWSPYGDICEVTSPGTPAAKTSQDISAAIKVSVSPNPFVADFGIGITSESPMPMQVKIYDMLGRLMETQTANSKDEIRMGGQYPSGVYNLIVTQGGAVKTMRIVKR